MKQNFYWKPFKVKTKELITFVDENKTIGAGVMGIMLRWGIWAYKIKKYTGNLYSLKQLPPWPTVSKDAYKGRNDIFYDPYDFIPYEYKYIGKISMKNKRLLGRAWKSF